MFSIRHESFGYKISYDGYISSFDDELRKFLIRSESYHILERDLKQACTRHYLDILRQTPYAAPTKYMSFSFMIAENPRIFSNGGASYNNPTSIGNLSEPIIPPPQLNKLLLLL